MVASSAMASITMSRPSSVLPIVQNLARRRGLGDRLEVAVDVLGVGQLARRADDPAEELERRRHRGRGRQVVDQFGA